MSEKPFFVGYLPFPKELRVLFAAICFAFVGGFAGAGLLAGVTQDAPENAGLMPPRATLKGVVDITPYPLIRITEGDERVPAGRTLMMTAAGKSGVDDRAMGAHGQLAEISGVVLARGTIDMIQLRGGQAGFKFIDGDAPALPPEDLGRWRLAGEICDGKCLYGAMRPGRGLAHKACANLCITGDIPPIFVSSKPVEGSEFMLITGPDGTRLPKSAYHFVGQFVELEGDLERRGDLLVLRLDPETIALVDE